MHTEKNGKYIEEDIIINMLDAVFMSRAVSTTLTTPILTGQLLKQHTHSRYRYEPCIGLGKESCTCLERERGLKEHFGELFGPLEPIMINAQLSLPNPSHAVCRLQHGTPRCGSLLNPLDGSVLIQCMDTGWISGWICVNQNSSFWIRTASFNRATATKSSTAHTTSWER
eukprot:1157802-Pelagomonas_calceolata.AAC.5